MLQAFGLSYEPSPIAGKLFENLNLSIDRGERVVLTGANGSGKTKLVEVLAGLIQPTAGRVVCDAGCRIGYLAQDIDLDFKGTLTEFLAPGAAEDRSHASLLKRACSRMEIDPSQLSIEYSRLSVGERVRAALAKLLMEEPTVLLLDEPTNHLDLDGRNWLVRFLLRSNLACLMVSHDRAVVNEVADQVLLLAEGKLTEYAGGYDEMVVAREQAAARQREQYERQVSEERRLKNAAERMSQKAAQVMKRPTGRTYDPGAKGFYAGKEAKMQTRAKAVRSRIEQSLAERAEKPFEADQIAICFNTRPLRHSDAVSVRGLYKALGGRELFGGLSFSAGPRERMALVGPNGSGKTTLMRILMGEEPADGGEIRWSEDAIPALLTQERTGLDLDVDILKALDPANAEQSRFVRTLLARLRIRGDSPLKPVRALSVGERTKVELTRILMTPANVLLLDEPTNHLDIDSLEALEEALKEYDGCILFTSHDAAFVERVATSVIKL